MSQAGPVVITSLVTLLLTFLVHWSPLGKSQTNHFFMRHLLHVLAFALPFGVLMATMRETVYNVAFWSCLICSLTAAGIGQAVDSFKSLNERLTASEREASRLRPAVDDEDRDAKIR